MEVWSGELESAIKHLRFGARLFPCDAGNQDVLTALAAAYYYSGDYQNSLEWAQRACAANRRHAPAFRYKAASHIQLGSIADAQSAMQHCLALQPHCTISMMRRPATMMAKDPNMLDHYFEALRLAGMPS